MRITGGTARGRNLAGPKSGIIRPTSDRVREALFSIIAAEVPGSTVLDLYAGTGAFGLEALSRGAAAAVFVDQSKQAVALIQENLSRCFAGAKAALLQVDLAGPDSLARLKNRLPAEMLFDLIFLDPPYEKNLAEKTLAAIEQETLLQESGLLIAEERKTARLPEQCGSLRLVDQRSYGETGLWFYRQEAVENK
ncbi:MAG: 16S rRNA (guanine966-N2)-methyltransferase [Candidatus Electronema aureum]|uniref:16S rRNA (Guanine966-N2)-methyltransferase n=1 Tax=Candidatus Electronema aureum TaxID=2005002 RepID=A0A521G4H9_9BACT|nr:MAG: 16S rRNA (guanine966-N2)-methyltransferase [Candidatus Electronema aureum]